MGNRVHKEITFGPDDEITVVPVFEGGVKGKIAVYARLVGSAGSATLRVHGAYTSVAVDAASNSEVQRLDFGNIGYSTSPDISELGSIVTANPEFFSQLLDIPSGNNDSPTVRNSGTYTDVLQPGPRGGGLATLPDVDAIDDGAWVLFTRGRSFVGTPAAPTDGYDLTQNANSFTLTYNTHVTAQVNYSSDMSADIQAALIGLADFAPGDVVVSKVSASVYDVTFGGAFTNVDATPITITNQTGFTAIGVTETQAGSPTSEDLTDTATLGNPISQIVADQENVFPYYVFVFEGDADPNLAAEAYIVAY